MTERVERGENENRHYKAPGDGKEGEGEPLESTGGSERQTIPGSCVTGNPSVNCRGKSGKRVLKKKSLWGSRAMAISHVPKGALEWSHPQKN